MATPKNVILKYKTTDIGLNKVLEAYRDKINNIIKNVPWVTASVDYVRFKDTNETHYLEMFWGEDDLADRTLELNVNSGNRVINLSGNLIVESTSTLNQDLTTDANAILAGLTLGNEGLHLLDTGGNHDLIIKPGSDLDADRILTITTGDTARTFTLSAKLTVEATSVINSDLSTDANWGTSGSITATSFVIGGNILDTNEWAFLDGLDQALKTSDAPGFATGVTIGKLTLADGSITESDGAISFGNENLDTSGYIALKSNAELRFYDNGNYVGFEAPALGADCIWVLPTTDGAVGEHMVSDGSKNLSWTTGAGTGNVNAAANITNHSIVRGDGGAKGVQGSLCYIGDAGIMYINDTANDNMTIGLTINQAANTDEIFAFKGTGVAHGCTDRAETDTYADFKLLTAEKGGLTIRTFHEENFGFDVQAVYNAAIATSTAKNTTATSPLRFIVYKKSGTGVGNVDANINLMTIMARVGGSTLTRWLVDEDGDTWQSGNITMGGSVGNINAGTHIASSTIYGDTTTNSASINIHSDPYWIRRVTSGKKYKDKIKDLELDSSKLHNIRPVSFNSLCGDDDKQKRFIGLIADEIEQVYPEIIQYNDSGGTENYDDRMLMTLMLAEIQVLRKEIDELKKSKAKKE